MINKDKTKLKYQYDVSELSPTSSKPIVWRCDEINCSTERDFAYAYYLKKQANAKLNHDGKELCQKCSHKHRSVKKDSSIEKPEPKNKAIDLPPEINEQRTMEKYGEIASQIPPWSRKKVVLNCYGCKKECESARCNLNMYDSIIQSGHFKCKGCFTGARRKGIKVSQVTKEKMTEAQHKRRDKEHEDKWGPSEKRIAAVANGDIMSTPVSQDQTATIIPLKRPKN